MSEEHESAEPEPTPNPAPPAGDSATAPAAPESVAGTAPASSEPDTAAGETEPSNARPKTAARGAEPSPTRAKDDHPPAEADQPGAKDDQPGAEADQPAPSRGVWSLVKSALGILRTPLATVPSLAEELSPTEATLVGGGSCILMALTYPLYRPANEDVIDGLVRYGFDVLIAAAGLAAFAIVLHLLRRFAFEQEEAELSHSVLLVGSFALLVAAAATVAWLLDLLRLGFLAPVVLGAGKVVGLCTLHASLRSITGLKPRGALLALAFAAGIANLIFARELGMGRLF